MMCGCNFKNKGAFGGIIFGALIGAVAGILLAPKSGKETREKLKEMIDNKEELLKETKEKTQEAVHRTVDVLKQGIEKISGVVQDKKSPYDRYKGPEDNSEAAA